jgi:hypothetical protein
VAIHTAQNFVVSAVNPADFAAPAPILANASVQSIHPPIPATWTLAVQVAGAFLPLF